MTFLGKSFAPQRLLQLIVTVAQKSRVVDGFHEVIRQDYWEEDEKQVKLDVLIWSNEDDNYEEGPNRAVLEIVEEEEDEAEHMCYLIEEKLYFVHDSYLFAWIQNNRLDIVMKCPCFSLNIRISRLFYIVIVNVPGLSIDYLLSCFSWIEIDQMFSSTCY